MYKNILLSISIGLFYFFSTNAQSLNSRIEATYSIKEILPSGKHSLVLGKVFYDINERILLHQHSFPEKQILLFRDTLAYLSKEGDVERFPGSTYTVHFSIYHLILANKISNFGLGEQGYVLMELQKMNDKVVSKWGHPEIKSGYMVISQIDNKVDTIIFYNQEGNVLIKQVFKDYQQVGRYSFPTKIYELTYTADGEYKKITEHKNIKIDDFSDEMEYYNYFDIHIVPHIRSGKFN